MLNVSLCVLDLTVKLLHAYDVTLMAVRESKQTNLSLNPINTRINLSVDECHVFDVFGK